jgi:translation initiation factor IF-1
MTDNNRNKFRQEEKSDKFSVDGNVIEVLPGTKFKVQLVSGQVIMTTLAGKLRYNKIKIFKNDRVVVELSPYDLTQGTIIFRKKEFAAQ